MSDLFCCCNCHAIVCLTRHGYCEVCGSDAVVRRSLLHIALLTKLWPEERDRQLEELEKLWERK